MPASFASVETDWFPEVRHHCPDVPYLLVGTQTDLRHDPSVLSREDQWLVTVEEGECLASRLGAVKYMECSALTQRGVKTVFDQASLHFSTSMRVLSDLYCRQ
jgi:cell division control protein 42